MLESMLVQRDLAGLQELEGFSFGQQKSKVGSGELHGHVDGVVPEQVSDCKESASMEDGGNVVFPMAERKKSCGVDCRFCGWWMISQPACIAIIQIIQIFIKCNRRWPQNISL